MPSFKGNYVETTSHGLDTVKVIGKPKEFAAKAEANYIAKMELPGMIEFPPASGTMIRNRFDPSKPISATNQAQGGAKKLNEYFWYNDFAPKHKLEIDTDALYQGYQNFLKKGIICRNMSNHSNIL